MRVAVCLEQDISVGGGFQQASSVLDCLLKSHPEGVEYVFFVFNRRNHEFLNGRGIENVWVKPSLRRIVMRVFRKLLKLTFGVIVPFQGYIDGILARHKIDLVYFLTPSLYAMGLRRHNFIITIWDQCHRDCVEFPEVRIGLEFESREYMYSNTLPKAVAILVDAESSRENMSRRYGVDLDRIYVAKFFPAHEENAVDGQNIDVCGKYDIAVPFIFYPAQFWPHKNHCYILKAVSMMREHQLDIVFVGRDYGSECSVRECAERLGVAERCHFLGFVPRADVEAFYKRASALVMPTYFGPTNIPPLEAFYYGCPVCYSDLPGLKDQVGDAAFLMDLRDPDSLTQALEIILRGEDIVNVKIEKGHEILRHHTKEQYIEVITNILTSYKIVTQHNDDCFDA